VKPLMKPSEICMQISDGFFEGHQHVRLAHRARAWLHDDENGIIN